MSRELDSRRTGLRASAQLAVAIAVLAAAIFGASLAQRSAADRSLDETAAAESMLIGQLDMETGLRGFLQFGKPSFLEPFRYGRDVFESGLERFRREAADDETLLASVEGQATLSARWQSLAREAIDVARRRGAGTASLQEALRRKAIMDRFRVANDELTTLVENRRQAAGARATTISVGLVLAIGVLFAILGYATMIRPAARRAARSAEERRFLRSQEEFSAALQVMGDETEVQELLRRHLERNLADADVVVLNRNASDNRLETRWALPDKTGRPGPLEQAKPESCLAVRTGQPVTSEGEDSLLHCELCGAAPNATCIPSLVGGRVIGSVLAVSDDPLGEHEQRRLAQSVDQAAPVLANLRSLAVAETRASTDGLTGLPNKRSCSETLRRMAAQASRTMEPLSAIMADIDHFKQINDRFGHGIGDEALAAVAATLASETRTSDFAGRYGGEEFLILLPATESDGAAELAEKLRAAICRIEIPALPAQLSASFGVASIPLNAGDAEGLVRRADAALYTAKRLGRNRVERAELRPEELGAPARIVGASRVEPPAQASRQ